jgi:hypothetical protein
MALAGPQLGYHLEYKAPFTTVCGRKRFVVEPDRRGVSVCKHYRGAQPLEMEKLGYDTDFATMP